MIYPADFESKLGFDRVRQQTGRLCVTRRARELVDGAKFSASFEEVGRRLALAGEMRTILRMESGFPADGFVDLHELTIRAEAAGAFLAGEELLVLRRGLAGIGEIVAFFENRRQDAYPRLRELLAETGAFPELVGRIDAIVDRFGQVRDSASAELHAIRRAIADHEGQVSKRLDQILREGQRAGSIEPDAALSIRDGRAVIPVSAANKRRVRGFIHDESATGKTFYIEPVEVVELNNALKELEYAERREVVRVLTAFTDEQLRPNVAEIRTAGERLAALDLIRAKARWALDNGCVQPILSDGPAIGLKNARHPLLAQALAAEGKAVVPLDLTLADPRRLLVVSGPNAGGKSVVLKTVGLLQYMLQCGWLIPASENSETGLFESLFLDMGDEQSIDNDLSTYSSHLLNMKTMLRAADERSLVLIDEFGGGTEPVLGGAIAEAVLRRLEAARVFGVITTHYTNLKVYAADAEGLQSGAMSFDVQKIEPLFRLEVGRPGSSFAIEIARKIGLPEEIIRTASELAGSGHMDMERILRRIARDKRYWEEKRERIRLAERRTDELADRYARELDELHAERGRLIKEAKEESRRLLDQTNKNIEQTIRTIRQAQAEKEKTREARRDLDRFRESAAEAPDDKRLDARIEQLRAREARRAERRADREVENAGQIDTNREPEASRPLAVGDKVRIRGQGAIGELLQLAGGRAVIGIGQIRTTIAVDKLERISRDEFRRITQDRQVRSTHSASYDASKRRLDFSARIDLRGERAADALSAVREYVDEAVMLGIPEVKILHGKGTGALKEEIRRYLATAPGVASAADEDEKFGGAGITVVRLDV